MNTSPTEKYFLFTLLSITIVITLLILYPFLTMFILAAAFAVVLNPVYLWIKKNIVKNISWLASMLTVIIFLLFLCIPLFFIGKAIFIQTQNLYFSIVNSGTSGNFIESINTSVNKLLPAGFNFDIHTKIVELVSSLSSNLAQFFSSTLNSIVMFILMVFTLFYLLKDGETWKKGLLNFFPLSDENTNEIVKNLKKSINRIFKGTFIIAIAQGILAWFGFMVFGVPNAVIWAVVAGVASFVPSLGTSVVSVPAILFLYLTGMEIQAFGLLLWSALLIGMIDNILSPYIISKDTEIPSLLVLFSILGALALMGPIGILVGPLILSLLYSLIAIYKKELQN